MVGTWKKQLETELIEHYGKEKGTQLNHEFGPTFPHSYMDDIAVRMAARDISYMEKLSAQNPLEMNLYLSEDEGDNALHLRLFQWQKAIPLSDILPMLENFDLRTENESPYKIKLNTKESVWISDFYLTYNQSPLVIDEVKEFFHEALAQVYFGKTENDGFNKLVLGASLSWHDVIILRTYAKYLLQIGFRFSQAYIEKALANNPEIAKDLVELFNALHNPENPSLSGTDHTKPGDGSPESQERSRNARHELCLQVEQRLFERIDSVSSLDEDRILRRLLDLIKATVRTNYFQRTEGGCVKDYLAIKLNSGLIPELPLPKPLCEIFVYSPRFEGIHLRKEKIARGGIRWSDRREDFRTEILGLMKAQVVKNSIIVPSGAKGGFVLKALPPMSTREVVQQEVVQCYQLFIEALLDLTDNIKGGQFISPPQVVCHDEVDPYLVVAADKGTATFSDLANSISKKYDFWLDDAFASGGSTGYDHKKMGITARGAWESIKRHFREFDCDVEQRTISVIGIGDMSGDVFGNGMLYSRRIKLIGAFDHRHIFIDPNPDPEVSYAERERLFNLPTSSWEDYNQQLISPGGGVFKRSLKSINLTPAMKQILELRQNTLTPNELIMALLKAPVDLLFNGGIGTYVKSSQETAADVGDKTNDYCRINGNELRCKVVGEGGNLGFTQRGRVEYSLIGGLIYTDFIDNSAGVDCSDHEVNLKILLNTEVCNGNLTEQARNTLLNSLTSEVAHLVLNDNKEQGLVMSFSAFSAKKNVGLHTEYIKDLETQGIINRRVEFLPDDKELLERKAASLGLTRPELAVLLAYTKIYIKQEILKTHLPEDSYFNQMLEMAFPASIRKKYLSIMQEHKLRRNIIATQLSSEIVNNMGITFVYRMCRETGASIEEIIRAYTLASQSFNLAELQSIVESLNFKIPMADQFVMLHNIRKLINLATRWFLRLTHEQVALSPIIEHYSTGIKAIEWLIPQLMSGQTKLYLDSLTEKFQTANLPKEIAQHIATYRAIYTSLNIIEVATKNQKDVERTAKVYFAVGERLNLVWFRDELANDQREDHWHALTRLTLRDELDILQQKITRVILAEDNDAGDHQQLLEKWVMDNKNIMTCWDNFLARLHSSPTIEYTMYFIAVRELHRLLDKKVA